LPELLSTVSNSQTDPQQGTEELGIYANRPLYLEKGQMCDPEFWLYMSFMGCGELDCPTCVIAASFVDHGYETNIYHLLQCWNGFWDLLWLENGNQDSQS